MPSVTQTLFGGSRFVRWLLIPALILFAILMTATIELHTPMQKVVFTALIAAAALMVLALASPRRFRWAGRIAAGEVFVTYLAASVDALREHKTLEVIIGLFVIGLPALRYAVYGRFGSADQPIQLDANDPLLLEAVRRARETIPIFLGLHREGREVFIKFAFTSDRGAVEHLWARVQRIEGDRIEVQLRSRPVTQRQPLSPEMTLPIAEIEDWQVFEDDHVVRGGFSAQAMIAACERERLPVPPRARALKFVDV